MKEGTQMPRKRGFCYDKDKYSKDSLVEIIEGKKKRLKISNEELGKLIGMTGQAFGRRLREANLDFIHLVKIFKKLEVSDDEIIKLMKQE